MLKTGKYSWFKNIATALQSSLYIMQRNEIRVMQCLLILHGARFELALIQGVVGTNGLKKPEFTGLKSFLPWDFCIEYICVEYIRTVWMSSKLNTFKRSCICQLFGFFNCNYFFLIIKPCVCLFFHFQKLFFKKINTSLYSWTSR